MTIRVRAVVDPERNRVEAATEKSRPIVMDGDTPDGEGVATGPRATLLAALAGCTGMDVASILLKKRQQPPDSYEILVHGESATEHPKVFTAIQVEHVVRGSIEPQALHRSIELSATRYCPVSAMLSASVRIEHRYRLVREGEPELSALVAVTGPRAG
ncbi:MAG: OsmC family protein [Candidatus Limnocylindria bacterium]